MGKMSKLAVRCLVCMAAMVTAVQSLPDSNHIGPSQLESVVVTVESGNDEGILPDANKAVTEIEMDREIPLQVDAFSTMTSENDFGDPHRLRSRQKRQSTTDSARLKRLLATKKGRKKLSRKGLLLALIKRKRKLRKQRKQRERKVIEENNAKETSVSNGTSDESGQQDNPRSTNEINLTVQVEMNEPKQPAEVDESDLSSVNDIPAPPMQGANQNYPFASPRIKLPPNPNNVFGVIPQVNNGFQRDIFSNTFGGQNLESIRSSPILPGILSGQEVMKNRGFLGSPFSEPVFNSGPYEKHLNNEQPIFHNQRTSFPENKNKRENFLNVQVPTQQDSNFHSRNNQVISDAFSSSRRTESQHINLNSEASPKRLDLQTGEGSDNLDAVKDTREGVKEEKELADLLQDIRSMVKNLKPQEGNDADTLKVKEKINGQPKMKSDVESDNDLEDIGPLPSSSEMNAAKRTGETVENDGEELKKKTILAETYEVVENPNILSDVKDQHVMYEEKLSSLSSDDFIKMLNNLGLITSREKKIIRRISPKWKNDNNIQMIFKELMRRRYFRNAIKNLLENEGITTVDDYSHQNLIIEIIKVVEKLNSGANIKTSPDYVPNKSEITTNSDFDKRGNVFSAEETHTDFTSEHDSRAENRFSDHESHSENIFSDNENQFKKGSHVDNLNENNFSELNQQSDHIFTDNEHQSDNIFADQNHQHDMFVDHGNQLDNMFVDHEHQHDTTFIDNGNHPHNMLADHNH